MSSLICRAAVEKQELAQRNMSQHSTVESLQAVVQRSTVFASRGTGAWDGVAGECFAGVHATGNMAREGAVHRVGWWCITE